MYRAGPVHTSPVTKTTTNFWHQFLPYTAKHSSGKLIEWEYFYGSLDNEFLLLK